MAILPQLQAQLYKNAIKPILFNFSAETVHNQATTLGKIMGKSGVGKTLTSLLLNHQDSRLEQILNGIRFKAPIGLSAGFDYNGQLTDILPAVGFGFHTVGTVTFRPYLGNAPPRLDRFPESRSLLVNKGLKSWGAVKVITHLKKKEFIIPVGISIASTNMLFDSLKAQIIDIVSCFKLFENSKVKHSYYELNISCPNTFGGEPFTTPSRLAMLLTAVDKLQIKKPIYAKMPIDQSDQETIQLLAVINKFNIAGVVFGNLTKDHRNPDVTELDHQKWSQMKGNLSGKPTWHRSNRLIKLTRDKYKNRFTIIGTGGVFTAQDAATKINFGANLVQLITGMIFEGPQVIGQINKHLANQSFYPHAK
jgi:dihydroorotate dehydrogenase